MKTHRHPNPITAALLGLALAFPLSAAAALSDGVPTIENQPLDAGFVDFIREALPERSNVDQAFLDSQFDPFLDLNQDAQVSVTFIDEGAGFRNTLGWFSFADGAFDGLSKADIDTNGSGTVSVSELEALSGVNTGWIFPNASKNDGPGGLVAGDTAMLGDGRMFTAGENVSFFLGQNSGLRSGDAAAIEPRLESRPVMYGLDFLNPEATAGAEFGDTSDTSRHLAMFFGPDGESVVMGFEDLNRNWGSDDDFNDAVFIASTNPPEAISGSNILPAPAPGLGSGAGGVLLLTAMIGLRRRTQARSEDV